MCAGLCRRKGYATEVCSAQGCVGGRDMPQRCGLRRVIVPRFGGKITCGRPALVAELSTPQWTMYSLLENSLEICHRCVICAGSCRDVWGVT